MLVGAVGERGDGLRPAHAIDLAHPGKLGRHQHQRVEHSLRRRHHHGDAGNAGDLGRQGIHQDRARIARRAARNIEPGGSDRRPALPELDAERVSIEVVLGQLPLVMVEDTVMGELKRLKRLLVHLGPRRLDLGWRDPDANLAQVEAVKGEGEIDQGCIALGAHARDDGGDLIVDVGGLLALLREKRLEAILEIRVGSLKPHGHGAGVRSRSRRARCPRRARRPDAQACSACATRGPNP